MYVYNDIFEFEFELIIVFIFDGKHLRPKYISNNTYLYKMLYYAYVEW